MSLPRYPTLTILAFAGLMLLTDVVPSLHSYKVMDWNTVPGVLHFVDRQRSVTAEVEEQQRLRPDTDPARQAKYPLDDSEHDLDRFYEALHKAEGKGKGAEARILHYGDSPTTADLITSDARALLQKQFGDAGHGFCLIAKPWAWYAHRGADVEGHGAGGTGRGYLDGGSGESIVDQGWVIRVGRGEFPRGSGGHGASEIEWAAYADGSGVSEATRRRAVARVRGRSGFGRD
jgi:hypothetical protein